MNKFFLFFCLIIITFVSCEDYDAACTAKNSKDTCITAKASIDTLRCCWYDIKVNPTCISLPSEKTLLKTSIDALKKVASIDCEGHYIKTFIFALFTLVTLI